VIDAAAAEATRRGRPRSEVARKAILKAAFDLFVERGLGATSMDAVAERAAVSKATIYRWWPAKAMLALDALHAEWETAPRGPRDTGSLRGDLLALVRPWVRLAVAPESRRLLAALIAEAQRHPEFAEAYRERFVAPRRDRAREVFTRAIARDEIPATTDVELAVDLLYGPLYHRLLHGHAALNDGFVRAVVEATLAAVAARLD
jgi:AcrR family transcriptional regulator